MSIKRISRRRVVAPVVEYVDKESLATKEGRKTPQDDRHAPGRGPSSPDPTRAGVPTTKATIPINKFTPPTDKF